VRGVESGSRTLKDAINEAMRDWVNECADHTLLLGSVLGAHPYPTNGAGFPSRDWARGAGTDSEGGREIAEGDHCLRRWRIEPRLEFSSTL